jgi:hypothetical protein
VCALLQIGPDYPSNDAALRPKRPVSPTEIDTGDARRKELIREQIEAIIQPIVPPRDSPGERFLREERHVDTTVIADVLGRTEAIGWHPAVYFNKKGHPLHGQRLGCIVGIMSDPNAFDDVETAR